jgi:ribosomal protein S18 acetylase RimI-like enzyme
MSDREAEAPGVPTPASGVDDDSIRRAIPRDLDRVVALWSALTDHHAAHDAIFTPRIGADVQIRRLLEATLRDPGAAIFVSEGERGFRGFCVVAIDRAPPILAEVERAEISDLWVTQDARRRGIGRALVARALGWAKQRGVARCEVRVHVRNAEGQEFWRSLGFDDWMDVLHRQL